MLGETETEGCMLCRIYGVKLHLIEKIQAGGQNIISHQLLDSSGSTSMDENASCYSDPQMTRSSNEGLCNFVPLLHKTTAPNKPIYIYIIYISQIHYWD